MSLLLCPWPWQLSAVVPPDAGNLCGIFCMLRDTVNGTVRPWQWRDVAVTCSSLMYHCSSEAGYDLPDVQLRLISSPTWYCSSSPVMCGPSLGRSVKQKTNRSGIRVLSDVGPDRKYCEIWDLSGFVVLTDNIAALWEAMFCSQVQDDSKTLTMEAGISSESSVSYS
jgi:hypothetical protein